MDYALDWHDVDALVFFFQLHPRVKLGHPPNALDLELMFVSYCLRGIGVRRLGLDGAVGMRQLGSSRQRGLQ